MTHFDREVGRGMTNYDVECMKYLDIMAKFKQETHKKGDVLASKYKNSFLL